VFSNPNQTEFDFSDPTEKNIELMDKDEVVVFQVEPLYTKVVFVGHCLLTIAKQIWSEGKEWKSQYTGLKSEEADIQKRVELLGNIINIAYGKVGNKDDELKVFVVPECFFLGPNGAYSVNGVSSLIGKLQNLVKDLKWRHWMFVFGTVNGFSSVSGKLELFNIAPVIRGGFQLADQAPACTKLIQKTFYSEEMPLQAGLKQAEDEATLVRLVRELLAAAWDLIQKTFYSEEMPLQAGPVSPTAEQPFFGEMFGKAFGATENEATFGRLVQELLAVTWDDKTKWDVEKKDWANPSATPEWANKDEVRISGKTIDAFCREDKKWGEGDWERVKGQVLDQVKTKGMISVVRDMRAGTGAQWGGDRFTEVVGWYIASKPEAKISPDVLKPDQTFFREDFIFSCARKPGPWLEADNLPRKITFGLEICADHSKARVKSARSNDTEIAKQFDEATQKVRKLTNEKKELSSTEPKFTREKEALEKIVQLLKNGKNDEAKKEIKNTFSEDRDPNTMEGLLNQRTEALKAIADRKPKCEEELQKATADKQRAQLLKSASDIQKQVDIHLVPSAGMVLLPESIAAKEGGFAFNCDGWNASSVLLPMIQKRGGRIVPVKIANAPDDQGHNPLSPHSELLMVGKPKGNDVNLTPVTTLSFDPLNVDVSEIFAEGPGQLHIYPAQSLPS